MSIFALRREAHGHGFAVQLRRFGALARDGIELFGAAFAERFEGSIVVHATD
ncbi:hypothetical protein J6500_09490 [Bradyrhizobium sp. WSM 1704]|uniref:hypothetical protein n=1 Tax=Bradyrhizobium semiaridum TaxID=2821404 RepID=UPI001CE2C73D|nr:hypothetical protein [Bradyrhizobium semiaridum]MCA6122122.1 hypothetical protein [Bradyrhizobium semiaridum]